jgi:hypothetical protein
MKWCLRIDIPLVMFEPIQSFLRLYFCGRGHYCHNLCCGLNTFKPLHGQPIQFLCSLHVRFINICIIYCIFQLWFQLCQETLITVHSLNYSGSKIIPTSNTQRIEYTWNKWLQLEIIKITKSTKRKKFHCDLY